MADRFDVMAHEIVHALIGPVHLPVTPDVSDLMEVGGNRSFRQRTGLEDTAHTTPIGGGLHALWAMAQSSAIRTDYRRTSLIGR